MTENELSSEERRRVKQRLIEVLATELQGVSPGALGAWRKQGSVPHHRRIDLMRLGDEVGLGLRAPDDFEGWKRVGAR